MDGMKGMDGMGSMDMRLWTEMDDRDGMDDIY